jgi:hypothetical protein
LLEQVRWPNGQWCPHCGTEARDDPPAQTVCAACAKPYSVTTGTMFEGSSLPVRLWFVVIHQMYFAEPSLPDEELRHRFGLDLPAVLSLCRRIGDAAVQETLPIGDELKRAITVRDRELGQDQVARSILEYMELTAVRDRLVQSRAEGTPVEDFPPGMTLEEALKKIEALIAEHDEYVIDKQDGYLVRYRPAEEPGRPAQDAAVGYALDQATAPQEASDAR